MYIDGTSMDTMAANTDIFMSNIFLNDMYKKIYINMIFNIPTNVGFSKRKASNNVYTSHLPSDWSWI